MTGLAQLPKALSLLFLERRPFLEKSCELSSRGDTLFQSGEQSVYPDLFQALVII